MKKLIRGDTSTTKQRSEINVRHQDAKIKINWMQKINNLKRESFKNDENTQQKQSRPQILALHELHNRKNHLIESLSTVDFG